MSAPARVYAIGDIHGRLDLLISLLQRLDADLATAPPQPALRVFLGDYVDRGPASRGVIDRLIQEIARDDLQTVALRGNHEQALLDFLDDPATGESWLQFGGLETLRSYGVAPSASWPDLRDALCAALPPAHLAFLRGLPLYLEYGDILFVHAGIRPGVALAMQSAEDLLWIRHAFLAADLPPTPLVVHGHTPAAEVQVAPGRLGIDTGAFATGKLTAVRLDGAERRFFQTGQGSAEN